MRELIFGLTLIVLTSCGTNSYYQNDTPIDSIEGLQAEGDAATAEEALTEEELSLQSINQKLEQRRLEMQRQREAAAQTQSANTAKYPTAIKVPGRDGFVTSPYTGKVMDVRNIPSGKLVSDPDYPKSSKKFFYIP